MRNSKNIFSITLLLILSLTLLSCDKKEEDTQPLSKTEYFMGTVLTVTLYDNKDEQIFDKAFDRVKEIESLVSINKQGTELDKVNENAGITPVKVSDDTYTIVKRGLEYTNLTKGFFDITVGPIVKLWSIGLPEANLPSQEAITEKLKYIDYNNLILNDQDKSIYLKEKGMVIDLGGIAKGYTADQISSILKEEGVTKAIIDLGGNVYALGEKAEGTPWKIGVQNPIESRGEIIGSLSISNKSIVTSGIYERYYEKDGNKYHHILSPFNGYPYENEIAGVTIVSNLSMDGDALSTSVFAMGVEKGLEFVNSQPDVDAIFITKNNEIYLSNGLHDIFKQTNQDFKLMN